jgi:hypothetical protein
MVTFVGCQSLRLGVPPFCRRRAKGTIEERQKSQGPAIVDNKISKEHQGRQESKTQEASASWVETLVCQASRMTPVVEATIFEDLPLLYPPVPDTFYRSNFGSRP